MGSVICGGKRPEEMRPMDKRLVMEDDKFILMMQCLRDARELFMLTNHFDEPAPFPHLTKWEVYEEETVKLAITLFHERIKSPVSVDTLVKIGIAKEEAIARLEENKELANTTNEMLKKLQELSEQETKMRSELTAIDMDNAKIKADCFLLTTVGYDKHKEFRVTGKMSVRGTNGATYTVDKQGDITKTKRNILGRESQEWSGRIIAHDIPFDDAIATVFARITSDADGFDTDKKCGRVSIAT